MKLATEFAEEIIEYRQAIDQINGMPALRLPGDGRLISDFADELGELLNGHGIFNRKGAAFTLDHEAQSLKLVDAKWLRTWIETRDISSDLAMDF
jgi:hypothetical protein